MRGGWLIGLVGMLVGLYYIILDGYEYIDDTLGIILYDIVYNDSCGVCVRYDGCRGGY